MRGDGGIDGTVRALIFVRLSGGRSARIPFSLSPHDRKEEGRTAMGQERKQNITQDDLFRFNYLLGAQLSPDGRSAVYAVGHEGVDEDREYASIWLLTLETGATRRLTDGRAHDSNPQWSPDGTRIAFLSSRDDVTQLYRMAAEGGEPQALTSMKQGVGTGPALVTRRHAPRFYRRSGCRSSRTGQALPRHPPRLSLLPDGVPGRHPAGCVRDRCGRGGGTHAADG